MVVKIAAKRLQRIEGSHHIAKALADSGGITRQIEQYGVPGFSKSHHVSDQPPKRFVTDDSTGVLLEGPEPDLPTQPNRYRLSKVPTEVLDRFAGFLQ